MTFLILKISLFEFFVGNLVILVLQSCHGDFKCASTLSNLAYLTYICIYICVCIYIYIYRDMFRIGLFETEHHFIRVPK